VQRGAHISADEALIQTSNGVEVAYLNIAFEGSFPAAGPVTWLLILAVDQYPFSSSSTTLPHLCPDILTSSPGSINGAPFTNKVATEYYGRIISPPAWVQTDGLRSLLVISGFRPGKVAAGASGPIADVVVCWTANAPIEQRAQYLSATVPLVAIDNLVDPGANGEIDADIQPYYGTSDYAVQAGIPPDTTNFERWEWRNVKGIDLALTAVDVAENQADTYHGFLSGIFLGIAGGALIGLITELLEPARWNRRQATKMPTLQDP
jgi:hypothetical protein